MDNENTQGAVVAGASTGTQSGQPSGQGATQSEGTVQATQDYAGFKTTEELIADYQTKKNELDNLSRLQGRQTNELGELRAKTARLEGLVQGIQTARPAQPAITLADLDSQLSRNEITLPEYLSKRDQIKTSEIRQTIQQEVGGFKSELQRQQYVERFMADNPGYVNAYTNGLLSEWIDRGYSGEDAWTQYKYRQIETENTTLKKQVEEQTNKARQEGIQAGTKIEAGKQAAGKVLGGEAGGGSFAQGKTSTPLRTHSERVQAGVALLERMRSGGS